jgi:hypothetical protein
LGVGLPDEDVFEVPADLAEPLQRGPSRKRCVDIAVIEVIRRPVALKTAPVSSTRERNFPPTYQRSS